ncbi:hypothetical protein CDAR_552021 [Caerostris darwini]|uniref:Uncharacterized protein n=1 Tax=Caerostris darwini TaxID=1538125 RepID=A0AAV4PI32_9ARAC|nr:hypothetical protein CDAR_552021 [Caerostris darwini]
MLLQKKFWFELPDENRLDSKLDKESQAESFLTYALSTHFTEQSGAVEACWPRNPEVRGSKPSATTHFTERSGAVEACWTHNPEVPGSKPRSASETILLLTMDSKAI